MIRVSFLCDYSFNRALVQSLCSRAGLDTRLTGEYLEVFAPSVEELATALKAAVPTTNKVEVLA